MIEFRTICMIAVASLLASTLVADADDVASDSGYRASGNGDYDGSVLAYLKGDQPKIVGGRKAPPGAFPWQVSLEVSWIADPAAAHFCGGSILSDRWIVTAAHCLEKLRATDVNVIAGTNVLAPGVLRVNAEALFVDKAYVPATHDHDVALVKLRVPLPLGTTMQSIPLMQDGSLAAADPLTVTGWGATREAGQTTTDLQFVEVPFTTSEACNDPLSYAGKVTGNMLCAGRAAGGEDACQGDSGGPLVRLEGLRKGHLVGIVSWGEGCARPGRYGVYTDVFRVSDWIQKCMADQSICR